jgi:site-specific recombinase XerD
MMSRIQGHTKLSTTQIYAKVLDAKIGEDMKQLAYKMSNGEKA